MGETVAQALLDAAGPTGAISVSFRIFPDHVEVDVLRSGPQVGTPAGIEALTSLLGTEPAGRQPAAAAARGLRGRPGRWRSPTGWPACCAVRA